MDRFELQKYVCSNFPGRQTQIKEVLNVIGGPRDLMPPLLVYGGPSCGKTSVILDIFRHLGRPYAYASCRSCYNPRLLFESLLNQIFGHKRTRMNNYGSAKKCERVGDFVEFLKEALNGKKFLKNVHTGLKEVELCEKGAELGFEGTPKGSESGFESAQKNSEYEKGLELGFKSTKKGSGRPKGSGPVNSPSKSCVKTLEKGFTGLDIKGSPQKSVKKGLKSSGIEDGSLQDKGIEDSAEVVYLIFDNIELLHEWSNGFGLISALFRLSDLIRMPNLGLIFISNIAPDAFYGHTGALEPLTVYFRDYTDDVLHQILLKGQPNQELYGSFLNAVLKPFTRVCRRVTELSAALEPLFEKYCEPIKRESVVPDEKGKRRLFAHLEPHIAPALNQTFNVPTYTKLSGDRTRRRIATKRPGFEEAFEDLDFHISVSGKYLLISAFIASRNPATLDATLFDSTGGLDSRKRGRKSTVTAMEKKEIKAQEQFLKGPGSFPLERLLAIFQCITAVSDEDFENQHSAEIPQSHQGGMELMSDALMQLSTLCNINLLYKGSSCPLEGAARYRCNIDQELALKIARSVNFPLSKYLYR